MHAKLLVAMLVALCAVVGFTTAVTPDLTIPLEDGWNTVSTPFDVDPLTGIWYDSTIAAGLYWDETTQEWGIINPDDFTNIIPATSAAFVYCDDPGNIYLMKYVPEEESEELPVPGESIPLPEAKIYFRGPSYGEAIGGGTNLETLKISKFITGNWYAIASPSINGDGWVAFRGDGSYSGSSMLEENKGYWIITTDSTTSLQRWSV